MSKTRDNQRRTLLKSILVVPGLVVIRKSVFADEPLPKLGESDPTAKALAYHHDAESVDPSAIPDRASNEYCHNCNFIQGEAGQEWRPCEIFPGKRVNANGWCKSWTEPVTAG